jgi:hypothetical protein
VNKPQGFFFVGLAILAAASVFFTRQISQAPTPLPQKSRVTQRAANTVDSEKRQQLRQRDTTGFTKLPEIPAPILSPHLVGTAENQKWIDERKEQLSDLSWFDDSDSLSKILAELQNPLSEIRAAALSAVRDFGSRDAVPYLQEIAAKTTDSTELKSLEKMIEHLNLPTVIEHIEGNAEESLPEAE